MTKNVIKVTQLDDLGVSHAILGLDQLNDEDMILFMNGLMTTRKAPTEKTRTSFITSLELERLQKLLS